MNTRNNQESALFPNWEEKRKFTIVIFAYERDVKELTKQGLLLLFHKLNLLIQSLQRK